MKKRDFLLIAAVLVVSLAAFGIVRFARQTSGAPTQIRISVGDSPVQTVPFGVPAEISLPQENGAENVVVVTATSVYMKSSTCKNQLCVHQTPITAENLEERPMAGLIVCLPNRVTIEVGRWDK